MRIVDFVALSSWIALGFHGCKKTDDEESTTGSGQDGAPDFSELAQPGDQEYMVFLSNKIEEAFRDLSKDIVSANGDHLKVNQAIVRTRERLSVIVGEVGSRFPEEMARTRSQIDLWKVKLDDFQQNGGWQAPPPSPLQNGSRQVGGFKLPLTPSVVLDHRRNGQDSMWIRDERFQLPLNPIFTADNHRLEVQNGMRKISNRVTDDLIFRYPNPVMLNAALERRTTELDELRLKMDNKFPAQRAETRRMIEQEKSRIRSLKSPLFELKKPTASLGVTRSEPSLVAPSQLGQDVATIQRPKSEPVLTRRISPEMIKISEQEKNRIRGLKSPIFNGQSASAGFTTPIGATRSRSQPSIAAPSQLGQNGARIQRSKSEPVLTRMVTPEMIKLSTEFAAKLEVCEKQATSHLRCEPQMNIQIASKGSVSRGAELGRGAFGVAYDVPAGNAVIKVGRDPSGNLCREKVGLEILNGLGGLAPRIFQISSGVSQACSSRVIALEKVGDADWANEVRSFDRNFYTRFARLIEVVRTLHEKGFIHHDLKEDNIRVKVNDPNYVVLIDFGILCSIIDLRKGEYSRSFTRKTDMEALGRMVEAIQPRPNWLNEFKTEMSALGPNDRPPYEKWIHTFKQIAGSMA